MAKKLLFLLVLISVVCSLTAPIAAVGSLYKVAVLPFDDSSIQNRWWGNNWEVGKGVSSVFVTELVNTKKFRVVEREQIDTVTQEQVLGASGPIDPNTAATLGKILGVQYLIIGKVTEFSNDSNSGGFANPNNMAFAFVTKTSRVAVDIRLVDTTSSEVKFSVTGKGEKKTTSIGIGSESGLVGFGSSKFMQTNLGIALRAALNSAASQLAVKAYEGSTVSGIIAYFDDRRIIIDLGSEQGLEPGMIFTVYRVIKEIRHPVTNEILDEITEDIAEVTVTEVKEKSANCTFLAPGNIKIGDRVTLKAMPPPALTPEEVRQKPDRINWK